MTVQTKTMMKKLQMSEFKTLNLASKSLDIGRVVIEASAGTGKTYSLTVLVVRHIAETELTADQLLMVTFTKAATAELRHKTRERAQEALECLRTDNKKAAWMGAMFATEMSKSKAKAKLTQFIAQFDEATITTIHGFCQIILGRLGLNSPAPANYTVQNNIENIIDQAITDTLAASLAADPGFIFGRSPKKTTKGEAQQFHPVELSDVSSSLSALKKVVTTVLSNPNALVLPQKVPGKFSTNRSSIKEKDKETLDLAERISVEALKVVDDVRRRCFEVGIITYDDMVRHVAEILNPTDNSQGKIEDASTLAANIAKQYRMIMVDEFQDTDQAQWSIFEKIYEAGVKDSTLLTVGDPKQSIYRFRGADVQVYIDSVMEIDTRYKLETNYRSDGALLTALQTLLSGMKFDVNGDVQFEEVNPADRNKDTKVGSKSDPELFENVPGAPLELRYLSNCSELGADPGKVENGKLKGVKNNDPTKVNQIFWQDCANHVVELLNDGQIPNKHSKEIDAMRSIKPSDIAILVNSHRKAETAVNYLLASGVPAVRLKTSSVFSSTAAMHWLMFLGAIANPGKPQYVRAFALSWFGDSSNEKMLAATTEQIASWQRECAAACELLQKRGLAAVYLKYRNKASFLKRILGEPYGERNITDVDHLAEIMTAIPRLAQNAGASECYETLRDLVEESDNESEENLRRIESDDDAVKVMTVHASKGLQFPIVFLPTLYIKPDTRGNNPLMFSWKFNGETRSQRVIDTSSGFENAKKWIFNLSEKEDKTMIWKNEFKLEKILRGRSVESKNDRLSESKRLLYVALTRAEHKVITYWSATGEDNDKGNKNVALAEILYAHDKSLKQIPTDKESLDKLMAMISDDSQGNIASIPLNTEKPEILKWEKSIVKSDSVVDVAEFTRDPGTVRLYGFLRWSYSALSKAIKGEDASGGGDGTPGTDETDPVADNEDNTIQVIDGANSRSEAKKIDIHIEAADAIAAMPLFDGVAGASFGVAVHKVFKEIDPSSVDIRESIQENVETQFASWSEIVDKTKISEGILKSIDSPLGDEFGGETLRSLGATHRLAELSFDFRLSHDTTFKISDIGRLMLEFGELNSDLTELANRLVSLGVDNRQIAGYMTGSIDAVFRIIDGDKNVRYIVSDYKSDQLHDPKAENENPLIHYHPERLTKPMVKKGYILQILVYSVALHRYLKWRQPEYDPEKHLGGAAYFFVRGMIGFETNESPARPYGVYFWRPPTKLILALDALFAGRPH